MDNWAINCYEMANTKRSKKVRGKSGAWEGGKGTVLPGKQIICMTTGKRIAVLVKVEGATIYRGAAPPITKVRLGLEGCWESKRGKRENSLGDEYLFRKK